jgi:hypothetical protein
MLLTRTVDGNMARAEATLARFVLDENPQTGRLYYSQWRQAGIQIARLRQLLRGSRRRPPSWRSSASLSGARSRVQPGATGAVSKQESGGVPFFYQAGLSKTGPALRDVLDRISDSAREQAAPADGPHPSVRRTADKLTNWLGWFGLWSVSVRSCSASWPIARSPNG